MNHTRFLVGICLMTTLWACQNTSKSKNSDTPADSAPVQAVHLAAQDTPPPTDTSSISNPAPETIPIDVLLGRIDPAKDTAFARIDLAYTAKSDIYMRRAAYEAFKRMHAAAAKDGVKLIILSATRPFSYQKNIWENKWTGKTLVGGKNLATAIPEPAKRAAKILEYSSMPNTSRHHWGTDIDLNNLENSYFAAGEGKKIYDWLLAHGHEHGFCQTYTAIGPERPNGYQEEKWHWSYMPIASRFLQAYQSQVQYSDIKGFMGAEVAAELKVIDHYVGGIAPSCKAW